MKKKAILEYLAHAKKRYKKEGFIIKALFGSYSRGDENEKSDVDILVEVTPEFASRYGFESFNRLKEIENELSLAIGTKVDLADSSAMGETAKKFIIDRAVYV